MPEPVIHATYFGLKVAYLLAGFLGGVVSLSFIKKLTTWQAVLAVLTGAISANYCTPTVLHLFPWIEEPLTAAWFVGLTAMNIIPGIIELSRRFRKNPQEFVGGEK